jgi:hypothetical protein
MLVCSFAALGGATSATASAVWQGKSQAGGAPAYEAYSVDQLVG